MNPPTRNEAGRAEELNRSVRAKLGRLRLARRRLGELQSTLFHPAAAFIDDVLREQEEMLEAWQLGE